MSTKELVEQTKKLMAIRSTANQPEALCEAVDLVANIVAKHPDITIERFERNGKHSFLAYKKGARPAKFDILLNAHVDVVPGRPSLFKPHVKNGRLYGRGALDMKGTAVTLTDVFCELVNQVPYALGLQIVSDEELGGYDGAKLHIDDGVRANFVIIGEYTNARHTIYNAARGLCWAEIAFKGKSAHGGHLWHGTNAVVKAGEFAAAVLKRYPTPDKETWTTTASIASLSTPNKTFNKVPDSAILKVDFRFTEEDSVFANRESLEAFIASIDPTAQLIKIATFEPAVNVAQINPYVQGLSAALQQVTHVKAKFDARPAGSDGRHYAMAGIDVVEFGLYGQAPHGNEEYVELASFGEYRDILRSFLRQPLPPKLKPATTPPKEQEIAHLAQHLSAANKPAYVWYAAYGAGLAKDNFMSYIHGGFEEGNAHAYKGCADTSPPLEDTFAALPYDLYFVSPSNTKDGGFVTIDPVANPKAKTIARLYLISLKQFEEIAAQHRQAERVHLPVKTAMERGHAIIGSGSGPFDHLVYCGERGDFPIFTLTANHKRLPMAPPSPTYTRLLYKGLSENNRMSLGSAVDYIFSKPGMAEHYSKQDLARIFAEVTEQ